MYTSARRVMRRQEEIIQRRIATLIGNSKEPLLVVNDLKFPPISRLGTSVGRFQLV